VAMAIKPSGSVKDGGFLEQVSGFYLHVQSVGKDRKKDTARKYQTRIE
jgi:hypothetical protein